MNISAHIVWASIVAAQRINHEYISTKNSCYGSNCIPVGVIETLLSGKWLPGLSKYSNLQIFKQFCQNTKYLLDADYAKGSMLREWAANTFMVDILNDSESEYANHCFQASQKESFDIGWHSSDIKLIYSIVYLQESYEREQARNSFNKLEETCEKFPQEVGYRVKNAIMKVAYCIYLKTTDSYLIILQMDNYLFSTFQRTALPINTLLTISGTIKKFRGKQASLNRVKIDWNKEY
jgi:hypothetical protein